MVIRKKPLFGTLFFPPTDGGPSVVTRVPKSPWQKYSKKRFEYSVAYMNWKQSAIKLGASDPKTVALSCHHARLFGVKPDACEDHK